MFIKVRFESCLKRFGNHWSKW